MKEEEYKYLTDEKLRNGGELEQAKLEIKQLNQSQIGFKNLKKQLRRLEKELEKKNKLIEKLQKSHFTNILPRTEEKIVQINNSKNNQATLRDLNRILSLFDVEERIRLSDLTETCIIKPKIMKGALNFLVRNNMIKEVNESRALVLERIR